MSEKLDDKKERHTVNEKTEPEIFCEVGADPGSLPFKVNRPFFLITKAGPPVVVPKGALVRLTDMTKLELFPCGKVTPSFLKDNDIFKVVRGFRRIDEQGLWQNLAVGTRVRLSASEAEDLLRKSLVIFDTMQEGD
ncbi:hypothetical protein NBG4_890012 [Candidatus Sulfobium mesophilum]|uniref:Uncharacterized protein n=1 Tax=Candidatus Sulfobium mesophilum TaxID=2016548 RepID=A0A2U3QKX0_9BACT|nr:hypothetical protein NBG4_890012 [Candidatus Sulfobium mesophilum]